MPESPLTCEEALRLVHRFLGEGPDTGEHLILREHLEGCHACNNVYLDTVGAAAALGIARRAARLQTGYLYHYAFAMLIGVALLVSWYLVTGIG